MHGVQEVSKSQLAQRPWRGIRVQCDPGARARLHAPLVNSCSPELLQPSLGNLVLSHGIPPCWGLLLGNRGEFSIVTHTEYQNDVAEALVVSKKLSLPEIKVSGLTEARMLILSSRIAAAHLGGNVVSFGYAEYLENPGCARPSLPGLRPGSGS